MPRLQNLRPEPARTIGATPAAGPGEPRQKSSYQFLILNCAFCILHCALSCSLSAAFIRAIATFACYGLPQLRDGRVVERRRTRLCFVVVALCGRKRRCGPVAFFRGVRRPCAWRDPRLRLFRALRPSICRAAFWRGTAWLRVPFSLPQGRAASEPLQTDWFGATSGTERCRRRGRPRDDTVRLKGKYPI